MPTITFDDADALARQGADYLAQQITDSPGPRVTVGLAGGSTPAAVYLELRKREVDWSRVDFWLSDERWVPWHHSDSNGKMAYENLTRGLGARFLRPRWAPWLEPVDSAVYYEAELRDLHPADHAPDLILLGMGEDGHTASLFPDTKALAVEDRWFVGNEVPQMQTWRLTATIPFLHRARRLVFLIAGAGKAEAVGRVARGDDLPTTRVANGPAPATFLLDRAAAAQLP
jgi:6-phosphogluconolactonase